MIFYQNADFAIIFFDVFEPETFENVPYWVSNYKRNCPNKPMFLVGNKADAPGRKNKETQIDEFMRTPIMSGVIYTDLSNKSNYNSSKPFIFLLKK